MGVAFTVGTRPAGLPRPPPPPPPAPRPPRPPSAVVVGIGRYALGKPILVAASMRPGYTEWPERSIVTTPAGTVMDGPTPAIRPLRINTVPRSMTRPGAATMRTLVRA